MQDPLTPDERAVLDLFADAWAAYLKLPEVHPMDMQEAITHVHAIQNIILARPATRYENWLRLQEHA